MRRVEAKSEDARTEGALGCQQKFSLVFVEVLGGRNAFGSWLGLVACRALAGAGRPSGSVSLAWAWTRCDVNSLNL